MDAGRATLHLDPNEDRDPEGEAVSRAISQQQNKSPNACSLWERGQGQPATDFNPPNQLRRIKLIPKPLHMLHSSPDLVNRASHCRSWVAIRMSNSRESITSYCVQYVCRWIRRPGDIDLDNTSHSKHSKPAVSSPGVLKAEAYNIMVFTILSKQ